MTLASTFMLPKEEAPAPDHGSPPDIVIRALEKTYGSRRALAEVSFSVGAGITGLLGPNGAGKSTLMGCLAGIQSWDQGQVILNGIDAERHPAEVRRRVGYMPERVAFPPEMRVESYLRFVARTAKRLPRPRVAAAVDTALQRAGLDHVRRRLLGNLSKGYRQRVGVAQALLGDPDIVLLDEPTAGLDPLNLLDIRATLLDYAAEHAVVLSTHGLAEARLLCDRLLVLSAGSLVYDGPVAGMGRADVRRVRLRVAAVPDLYLAPVLAAAGWTAARPLSNSEVIVDVDGDKALVELSRTVTEAGFCIVSLAEMADAIEESFREAVLGNETPQEVQP